MNKDKEQRLSYEYEMRLRFSSNKRLYDDELNDLSGRLSDAIQVYCIEKDITNETTIECDA